MYRLVLRDLSGKSEAPYFITIYPHDQRDLKNGETLLWECASKQIYTETIAKYTQAFSLMHFNIKQYNGK